MHGPDYTREIELQPDTGYLDGIPATFSTWTNYPGDLPSLTLESVKLGGHTLNRTALIEWLGKAEVERMEAECRHSARVVVLKGNEALLPARGQGARFGRQSVSIVAERAVKQGNLADGAGNQIGFFRRVQRAHIGLAGNVERRRHRGKRPQNRLAAQHQNHGLIGDRTGGADDVLKLGARHGRTPA